MPTFIDKNPAGVETWIDDRHGDPGIDIHYSQNVEPVVDFATKLRNNEDVWKNGVKRDFVLYAVIPTVEMTRMLVEDGVDVGKPEDQKKMFELLNTRYKKLKTTTKVHRVK